MNKFFSVQRMLNLAQFRYYSQIGINADVYVCNQCLPIVVTQGIDFQEQCGENLLTGHVFVDNNLMADHTFEPVKFNHECANCEHPNTMCWRLNIQLSDLEYLSERDSRSDQIKWGIDVQVEMLGKRGRIVQQTGYDLSRPWIAIYTIKFEDGQRIDAKRWQFQIVKDRS